ncbi:hypothetical protein ABT158_23620 [Nonomuraea sp. NPDC001636]|uniref:hypothetical protein n=1 Tax=Nonomuraea sp. NPDC001636 TaxID=3154391 RepID=UPI00331AD445
MPGIVAVAYGISAQDTPAWTRIAAVLALCAAPYFGSALLMPTYVQTLRLDSASVTAALMIPGAVGASLAALAAMDAADRAAQAVTVTDALRLTQAAALVVMSLALVVRLRSPARHPALPGRRKSAERTVGTP